MWGVSIYPEEMKIIQIAVNDSEIYILDNKGNIKVYDTINKRWSKLQVPKCYDHQKHISGGFFYNVWRIISGDKNKTGKGKQNR